MGLFYIRVNVKALVTVLPPVDVLDVCVPSLIGVAQHCQQFFY